MNIRDDLAYLSQFEQTATGYQSPLPVADIDVMAVLNGLEERSKHLKLHVGSYAGSLTFRERATLTTGLNCLARDRSLVESRAEQLVVHEAERLLAGD